MKPAACSLRVAVLVLLTLPFVSAQSQRITQPIDSHSLVSVPGSVPTVARAGHDEGAVPDSFPANRILLLLRRSPEQQAALDKFLSDVHAPGNAIFHKWLTPAQFGAQFGPADADVATIEQWLRDQGFSVRRVTPGKSAIEFSGTAGQIRQAFHTEIHTYTHGGRTVHANNAPLQIPAAFSQVIAGTTPIYDLRPQPNAVVLGKAKYDPKTHETTPLWTIGTSFNGLPSLLLGPGDFAVQYDLNPLYQAGVNGNGITIGVIGASNIDPKIVSNYQSLFSLSQKPVTVIIDGTDPGENWARQESFLDVELAGSVAPGANIDLYTAADTRVQSGLALAAQRAVDEDAADILSVSYGTCEQQMGPAGNAFWNAVWEQAAAQGQTVLVSSGDGGPAGCDNFDIPQAAQNGEAVNGIGSTPWNLSVGGTDFYYTSYDQPSNQTAQVGTYWSLDPTVRPAISLLKAVPEQPWNRPFGLNLYDGGKPDPTQPTILSGSGGASSCVKGAAAADGSFSACSGGYAKPSWQRGHGVPSDGARDLPDLSLYAAVGENASFYPFCFDVQACLDPTYPGYIEGAGGTSASVQVMAGILALVEQKHGRQGQAANVLYPLAVQHPEVFRDVAVGNIMVPCQQGTADCKQSTANDATNGYYVFGYPAGTGYDLASGLGSVDANLLVSNWDSLSFTPTTTDLVLSQTSFAHGTPITAQVTVTASGGTPSGDVALTTTASPISNTGVGTLTLESGAASSTLSNLPGGTYSVTARYGGDGTYAASESASVAVTVTPEASAMSLSAQTQAYGNSGWTPLANGGTYVYGAALAMDASPHGSHSPGGVATGTVTYIDANGASVSVAVNSAGTSEWLPTPGVPAGNHSIVASYSGDASYSASKTPPLSFIVQKATPLAGSDVMGQGIFESGTPATLIQGFHVTPPWGGAPSGTIDFFLDGKEIGSGPVYCCDSPPNPTPYLWVSGAMTTKELPIGKHTITTKYSGDINYNAIDTGNLEVIITPNARLNISATESDSDNQTPSFTVTAKVPGAQGEPTPTGTVILHATQGSAVDAQTVTVTNGAASYTFPGADFQPGAVNIDAQYSGDAIYAGTTASTTINLFELGLSGTNVTMTRGGTGTSTITLTPRGGFTGAVALSCSLSSTVGTPPQSPLTCGIAPSVTVSGSNPVTTQMTFSASGSASASHSDRWAFTGGATAFALLIFCGIPAHRRRWTSLLLLLLGVGLVCGVSACSHFTGATTCTSCGTYNFAVTATSSGANGSEQATTHIGVVVQ